MREIKKHMSDRSRTKSSITNMFASLLNSIIAFIIRFAVRRLFLEAFGISVFGYNATFNSLLGMLNLAELGIGTAITYKMYEPIAKKEYNVVQAYLEIYKKLYFRIGIIIFSIGVLFIPLLPVVVKESYSDLLYLASIYLLQLLVTVASYWIAYRRILFNVFQDNFISSFVDTIVFIIISIIQIIDMKTAKNYYLYLLLTVLQIIISNLILQIISSGKYSFVISNKENIVKYKFSDTKHDISNVMISKFGGYVLNSTDALVVSTILGAAASGLLANYSTIYISFQTMILAMLSTLQPSLGNKIYSNGSRDEIEQIILRMTFMCQLAGSVFSITAFNTINAFVSMWVGEQYLLESSVAILYSINTYIYIVMYPISLIFGALGYYKFDKKVISLAAITNIILSVLFVKFWDISGVLIGTGISLLMYWVCRVYLLYKEFYNKTAKKYIYKVIRCFLAVVISVLISFILPRIEVVDSMFIDFIINCVQVVLLTFVVNIIVFINTDELKYLVGFINRIIKR